MYQRFVELHKQLDVMSTGHVSFTSCKTFITATLASMLQSTVRLSVRLSVCHQQPYTKRDFLKKKLSNLRLWSLLTTYSLIYISFSKNSLLDP